jgi:internalin A
LENSDFCTHRRANTIAPADHLAILKSFARIEALTWEQNMTQEELLALIEQAADEGWKELDLSGKELTELPAEIGKLTQLETLTLGKVEQNKWEQGNGKRVPAVITNQLTTLPQELASLENLQSLDLSGNPLTVIPESVLGLQKLTFLTLARVNLSEIPDAIVQLSNLTTLDLSSNQLNKIPNAIAQLSNLTTLYLWSNQLSEIPNAIAQLSNLTGLYLSNNQISGIPDSIAQLLNLIKLNLSGNQLSKVPSAIAQLSNLTTLDLARNQLSEIPETIAQLSNLTVLDLHSNQLTQIPEAIAQLSNLTVLALGNNQLTQFPEAIAQLTNLTVLSFSSNQLTQFPEAIAQLTNLTVLSLSNNQLTQFPEAIAQLTNLTELYLHNNQLTQIQEAIAQLTHLTVLSLWGNQLTQIPEAIAQLTHLTVLSLWGNQLTQIPEAIAQLTNLTELYLGDTQLTQIPEAIAQLTNLEKLYLENNRIKVLPDWLEQLPRLKTLDLRRNPLPISPEVLGSADSSEDPGSVEGIFNYCRQLRSGEVRPLNEAKLLLIGQGSVGKTSLINRLINDQFNINESQTDGLNVQTWSVHVNSKDVRLNVWDFGGQEIYHATHQFFLTKRSLYLLVCNCRTSEDENRIEYWLKLIESFGGQSPVIIVGNKKDEQPLDINRKGLRDKYPNIKAIIETSCQTNDGIDDLRQAIIREVGQLSDVYNLLPLSWFEVKEQLEAMEQDCISYSKYAYICETKAITEEQNQEQLIELLHNLGLVLSFRNHPILQHTNVLNPDWVTQGIYALLSDEALKIETKGILAEADLSRILDLQRYPANRHHYLTELMKEFQLCFPLPDCPAPKFLIPGLLPKEEPEDTRLEGDTLEFQYHHRILPESILSRFIVLTHEKIHNHVYWRSGVMLAYTENSETYNIAQIKADLEDKKIFISISGRESTRRLFLGIIRDVFNKIHSTFANPDISEWVPVPGHPDHPPLDYQELLGLEDMGIQEYPIGKLKLKVNVRKLLDGYEPIETRQRRRMNDRELDKMGWLGMEKLDDRFQIVNNIYNTNQQENNRTMTENTNNLQGANIGNFANEVKDNARQQTNQHIHQAANQNLAQAAQDIKALLNQLDQDYDSSTPTGQAMISAKAIESIEKNPTLKARVVNALKEGGTTALEVAIDHPAVKPVVALLKGFMEAK